MDVEPKAGDPVPKAVRELVSSGLTDEQCISEGLCYHGLKTDLKAESDKKAVSLRRGGDDIAAAAAAAAASDADAADGQQLPSFTFSLEHKGVLTAYSFTRLKTTEVMHLSTVDDEHGTGSKLEELHRRLAQDLALARKWRTQAAKERRDWEAQLSKRRKKEVSTNLEQVSAQAEYYPA